MTEPRYRPLERLAAGGMAEVFVAEATSVQGFKKKVAIKRVLPHLAENKNFIGMFLDEARLGARMSHANCVSVFDIGSADNTYFIVMEFVDGCDLKTIIEYFKAQNQPVPYKEAIFLTMEACRGLHYAHELTDDDGELLHIVHRDISPPNILISKRGEVKVTDFGLAKASTQLEKTDSGVVKGKFAYLSPEAVSGQTVDARADVFALAIVLWEMISGQRLFLGENDYQTVKLVQAARVPSLVGLNPAIDAEFDAIMQKALARDIAQRYQTAADFGDALTGYLFKHGLKVTGYDIANIAKAAITAAQAAKPKQSVTASLIDQLIQEEMLRFTSIDGRNERKQTEGPSAGPEGSTPLDAGDFVDPASWFGDDDLGSALESGESGWKESGILDTTPTGVPLDTSSSSTSISPSSTSGTAVAAEGSAKQSRAGMIVLALIAVVATAVAIGALLVPR